MKLLTHLDDVGMSVGSVDAWIALSQAGVIKSASTMVPALTTQWSATIGKKTRIKTWGSTSR